MNEPGILRIGRFASKDFEAVAVSMDITVEGEKVFAGNAALEQSQNVRRLVNGLKELGVKAEDFQVSKVKTRNGGGVFGGHSRAVYDLRIRITDMKKIGECVALISSQGGTVSNDLRWEYDYGNAKNELSGQALAAAMEAARVMAAAIGHRVTGLKGCDDGTPEYHPRSGWSSSSEYGGRIQCARASSWEDADIGIDYRGVDRITQWIAAEFYIAPEAQS